jgi:hypothetical protein
MGSAPWKREKKGRCQRTDYAAGLRACDVGDLVLEEGAAHEEAGSAGGGGLETGH